METEPETITDGDVQLAVVDPLPSASLEPAGAEANDVVDTEQESTTLVSPVEPDLEALPTQVADDTETPDVADAGSTTSLVTIDDGKRALADRRFADAIDVFTELADAGNAEAQAHLGYMYYKGEGVPVDLVLAVDWYERAAVLGAMRNTTWRSPMRLVRASRKTMHRQLPGIGALRSKEVLSPNTVLVCPTL